MFFEVIGVLVFEFMIFMDVNLFVVVVVVVDSLKFFGLNLFFDSNNVMIFDGSDLEFSDIDEVVDKFDGKFEFNDVI